MTIVPASIPPAQRALANAVSFVLLAVAVALAAGGIAALADARQLPLPVFPGFGLALAGLALAGRRFWPAVLLGAAAAPLIRAGHFSAVDLLACIGESAAAWLGAGLIGQDAGAEAVAPSGSQLLSLGGCIAVMCLLGTTIGAMLRGGALDAASALRECAVIAPVELLPALALLAWPAGATPRAGHHRVALLLPVIVGFAVLGIAALRAIDAGPGRWSAVPVLLWCAFAARRRAYGAATILLLVAGCVVALFGPASGFAAGFSLGDVPPHLVSFIAMTVTAALLIDAIGVTRHDTAGQVPEPAGDARMTAFVAAAPVAVAALDRDLRYLAVSNRYLQDLQLGDSSAVVGRRPADVLTRYAAHLGDAPARALAGEKVSCAPGEIEMADGSRDYLRSDLQPWYDASGAVGGVMVYGEIVTDSVASRAALEDAELRYRSVFEQAAAGFARFALDGRFIEVNERFCEIAGHDRSALLGKTYRDITHPLDLAACDAMLHAMIARPEERFSIEKRYVARDGRIVWVTLSATTIRDGDAHYVLSSVQDITARKETQAALAKSELRLRLAQSAAGAGLWEIDFDRDTIIASPDMLRMHGMPADRTDGVPLSEWRALFDRATNELIQSTGFASREIINHDLVYSIDLPDGTLRWIHSMGRTYKTTDNSRRLIGLAIDVTAAQTAQAELQQAQAAMLRISHLSAMGSVAATLAHELNQPLAAIVNYIEVCAQILKARRDSYPPQLLDAVQQAQAQALRSGQLVQKMRSLTTNAPSARRRQSGKAIVENACAMIAHEAANEDVAVSGPAGPDCGEVIADRLQIEQVLLGIFYNAMEAMHDSPDKRIALSIAHRRETIVIRVADSGPGLPEAALQRLFEPFGNPRGRGSGLALPVCRTIVEAHDGKLTVEVAPEGGAAFLIALPIAPAHDARADMPAPPSTSTWQPGPPHVSITENRLR